MKILYLASQADTAGTLDRELEIQLLQSVASKYPGTVEFVFLPNASLDTVDNALQEHRPTILHLSAHGTSRELAVREGDQQVPLTGHMLLALMGRQARPKLLFLNACNSIDIARSISADIPMVIGTDGAVTNRAATGGAVALYSRLFSGHSVADAHAAQAAKVLSLDEGTSKVVLLAPGSDAGRIRLHEPPALVAAFTTDPQPDKDDEHFSMQLGVVGCPPETQQVVFFTNDASFISRDDKLERDLCYVTRDTPGDGEIWIPASEPWRAMGDHRIFATGVTGGGSYFTVSSTVGDAIDAWCIRQGKPRSKTMQTRLAKFRSVSNPRTFDDAESIDGGPASASLPKKKRPKRQ